MYDTGCRMRNVMKEKKSTTPCSNVKSANYANLECLSNLLGTVATSNMCVCMMLERQKSKQTLRTLRTIINLVEHEQNGTHRVSSLFLGRYRETHNTPSVFSARYRFLFHTLSVWYCIYNISLPATIFRSRIFPNLSQEYQQNKNQRANKLKMTLD